MAFQNDVVGGVTLLRAAIRSANYIPGVAGWSINRDGTAEFASGTFRGPVIVIDPMTQNVLASIGATGNISGQVGTFNDVILSGTNPAISLANAYNNGGHGYLGGFTQGGALPSPLGLALTNICWAQFPYQANRTHLIYLAPFTIHNPTIHVSLLIYHQYSFAGSTGGYTGLLNPNQFDVFTDTMFQGSFVFQEAVSSTKTVTLQMNGNFAGATMNTQSGTQLFSVDIGPNYLIVPGVGGTGSPPGVAIHTNIYLASSSQGYDHLGNPSALAGGTNDISFGKWDPTSPGAASIACFPGATIRTDLTGATSITGTLNLYCTNSIKSAGSLNAKPEPNTTPPGSYLPAKGSGTVGYSNVWPLPGWHAVSLLDNQGSGSLLAAFQASSNAIGLPNSLFADDGTFFKGVGSGGSTIPYMSITYTK